MRPEIEETARALAKVHGYAWALLDVLGGDDQAYLYFPDGTATATIQSHVNRRVTPLLPVEVWAAQVSQQGSGVQAQAAADMKGAADVVAVKAVLKDEIKKDVGAVKQLGQHILRRLGIGS